MSSPCTFCNVCQKPISTCACPRYLNHPPWQAPSRVHAQTPRRPALSAHMSTYTHRTPHFHARIAPVYQYHQQLYDPRSHMPPILPTTQHGPSQSLPLTAPFPPLIPAHQTPSRIQQPLRFDDASHSPAQQSPVAVLTDGRKRRRSEGTKVPSKRVRRTQAPTLTHDSEEGRSTLPSTSVPGVGPTSLPEQPPAARPYPIANYSPISRSRKTTSESKQLSTDVWYFMRPLDVRERPREAIPSMPPTREKPKTRFVGCRLCPLSMWSVWTNSPGMADTIRTHLSTKHGDEWRKIVKLEKLKGWDKILGDDSGDTPRESFTVGGFHERLVQWIAIDDQSLNVLEMPELRSVFLYLNSTLEDSDIPRRKRVTELVFKRYNFEWKKLVAELRDCDGRISLTSDLWSDPNLRSFMAITAHYPGRDDHGNLLVRNRLVAFRHVLGVHSGANLAEHFLVVLKELGVSHKIGMITLDNASNCGSMMQDLSRLLKDLHIPFDAEGNRVRCFPHIINIAVKAALKELSQSAPAVTDEDDVPPYSGENKDIGVDYEAALKSDLVAKCRMLVTACRASGQRREDLQATIAEGNSSQSFPDGKQLRNVQLLRDVDTRWSSVYLMIDRVLELYPAIDVLLNKVKYKDIHRRLLDDTELQVLRDIAEFLKVPHAFQTTLCAEKTPTLSAVLPAYEDLLSMLHDYKIICPQLGRAISACIVKIEDYVKKSRKTRVYALAMIINPITKLKWIEEHWTAEEHQAAKEWMLGAMYEYRKMNRRTMDPSNTSRPLSRLSSTGPPTSASAQSQASGLAYIRSLKTTIQRSVSQIQLRESPTSTATDDTANQKSGGVVQAQPRTQDEARAESALADEKDRILAADEFQCYLEEGILDEIEYQDFNLILYWQARRYRFPTMYQVALSILPVQASSVACERVFSSSKETITLRRCSLSPELMETLQFLKYTFRQDRLNLMDGLISSEQDLLGVDVPLVSTDTIRGLLTTGQIDELVELLNNHK